MFNTPEEIFSFKLGSAHNMEKKLFEVLEELEQAAHSDQIKQALREHREETRQHAMNIERCFALLGEDIDDSPCPVIEAMAKEGKATIKKTDDSLVDAILLVAATESEHYEIAVYANANANANARGATEVAELLQQNLDQDRHALEVARSTMQIADQGIAATNAQPTETTRAPPPPRAGRPSRRRVRSTRGTCARSDQPCPVLAHSMADRYYPSQSGWRVPWPTAPESRG